MQQKPDHLALIQWTIEPNLDRQSFRIKSNTWCSLVCGPSTSRPKQTKQITFVPSGSAYSSGIQLKNDLLIFAKPKLSCRCLSTGQQGRKNTRQSRKFRIRRKIVQRKAHAATTKKNRFLEYGLIAWVLRIARNSNVTQNWTFFSEAPTNERGNQPQQKKPGVPLMEQEWMKINCQQTNDNHPFCQMKINYLSENNNEPMNATLLAPLISRWNMQTLESCTAKKLVCADEWIDKSIDSCKNPIRNALVNVALAAAALRMHCMSANFRNSQV